ncbi:MAG: hypothetical protein OEV43_07960 [Coriobacteriia bacterium]|nr:hypothetical protein [Coriobacteriia bacterium]
MRGRAVRLLLGMALVAVLAFAITGCNFTIDETEDADDAINAASEHADTYNDLNDQINEYFVQVVTEDGTPEAGDESLAAIAEMEDLLGQQGEEVDAMRDEYDKVADLNVSEDLKDYADMMLEATDLLAEVDGLFATILEYWNELAAMDEATFDEARHDELAAEIAAILTEMNDVEQRRYGIEDEADVLLDKINDEME